MTETQTSILYAILECVIFRRPSRFVVRLRKVFMYDCLDDRDRVYGLLSVFQLENTILPDYTLSVEEIYQKAMLAFIELEKNLDILLC